MPHTHLKIVPLHSAQSDECADTLNAIGGYAQHGLIHGFGMVLIGQGGEMRFVADGTLAKDHDRLAVALQQYLYTLIKRQHAH